MPEQLPTALTELTQLTVESLSAVRGDKKQLENAMLSFLEKCKELNLNIEQIENMLGVNEQSIMDLAQLNESDEEVLIDFFEDWAESSF